MAFMDYINGPKYRNRIHDLESQLASAKESNEQMQGLVKKLGAMELIEVKELIHQETIQLEAIKNHTKEAEDNYSSLSNKASDLKSQILVFEESILLESFALYEPKFKMSTSLEFKSKLELTRERQKAMIKNGEAATGNMGWAVNGSNAEGKKLVNDMIKLVIRSFNNEADFCVDNVKFDNIELGIKRIQKSFEACNRLGRIMTVRISEKYLDLKLDELRLAHEYQLKKQEEKEEAKRAREELREQQKLEQEIRAAREKIAKERKHFSAAIRDIQARLEKSEDNDDRLLLLSKIAELEANKALLDNEEKAIDYREQNAKAGYVYVISNIGAFGEGVYKIGMTRRLEPMDRIDELGDASVPFWFDVHAMIFSENAPALEAKLHERFSSGRLNKVNGRKEFFRADLSEIESVIRSNFDAVVEITHEASAEQYRESLRMATPG